MNLLPVTSTYTISIYIKMVTTGFLCVLVPVYWIERGPENFLWFSDIALITLTLALWLENRLLVSMMAVAVLLPELIWNMDFFFRLFTGHHLFGLDATSYMFDSQIALKVRIISFVMHLFLPTLLLWLLYRWGYQRKAWLAQTAMAWVIFPLTYGLTDPVANINFVYGINTVPQQWLPPPVYLGLLMLLVPLVIYLPTHFFMNWLFGKVK